MLLHRSWASRVFIGHLCSLLLLVQATASDVFFDWSRDRSGLVGPVREVVERFIHWRDGAPVGVGRSLYDRDGRLLASYRWEEINGTIRTTGHSLFEYDSDGRVVSVTNYDEEGAVLRQTTYKYDNSGHGVEKIDRDGERQEESRVIFERNSAGRITERRRYIPHGHRFPDGQPISRITWHYDDRGRNVKTMSYRADGSLESEALYKYDGQGHLSETVSLNSTGSVWHRDVYRYDESGRKVAHPEYDAEGTLAFRETYTYKDDARGNWIEKKPRRWSYDKSGKEEQYPTEVIARQIIYFE